MDNHYYYSPLSQKYQTRMLQISPGINSSPLHGQLHHVDLNNCPSYEALSYEWGNPQKECTIILTNGKQIPITRSLYNALQDLRYEKSPRLVWADGICVHQDDIEERQKQVSIMGVIYSKAYRVLTYIGPEKDGSAIAIDFAYELLHQHESGEISDPVSGDNPVDLGLPPLSDPRYLALKKLILRGWSTRSWCAQEFLLNTNLTMLCGRRTMDWFVVPTIVQLCFERSLPAFLVPNAADDTQDRRECLIKLWRLRRWIFLDRIQLSFLEFLTMFHPFQATDPKDKIYSLYGLLRDNQAVNIPVDYECTVEQLFTKVATQILSSSSSLHILYSNFGKKSLKLPSWVPDWSTWQVASQGLAMDLIYLACGSTIAEFRVQSMDELEVAGFLIDQISQQTDPIGQSHAFIGAPGQDTWLKKQLEFVQEAEPYPTGEDISSVLWRTMIGNITLDEDKAEEDYGQYFEAYRSFSESSSSVQKEMGREFVGAVRRRSRYRRLCLTQQGYFGGVPEGAELGDWICMFHGMKLLFVVRTTGLYFRYIGHCYMHGLMNGEVLQLPCYKKRVITLM